MSTINFPNNPTLGELFPFNGKTWQWNGNYWGVYSGSTLSIVDLSYSANTGELWYTKSDLSQSNTSIWSYITGGSYNTTTREITLSANTGGTFTISNLDYNGVTDLDYNVTTRILSISRPSGPDSVDLSSLIGNLVYSGTYNSTTGVVTFYPVDGDPFTVSGFLTEYTNTYTTGFTYNPNTGLIQFNRTDLQNAYSGFTSYYVSGTTNYIPKFNSTGVTNSQIFDNGSSVTIGYGNNSVTNTELLVSGYTKIGQSLTTTAQKTLQVSGNINMEQVTAPTGLQLTGVTFTSNSGGGSLSAGTYHYDFCFVTAEGETECVISNFYYASGVSLSNGSSMSLSNIPVSSDPRVTGRKVFRSLVNPTPIGGYYFTYLIATITNNTQTTFTDTISDSSINTSTAQYSYRKANTTAGQLFVQNNKTLFSDTYNTVFGNNAYLNNVRGNSSVAIGVDSLRNNTTGSNNVSVGYASSISTTTGNDNVTIGYASNYLNSGGTENVAIGSGAMRNSVNVTQDKNVAIGAYSMLTSSASSFSVAVGYYTGRNFHGNYNTFIGYSTASYSTQRGGLYNIFIGNQVGNSMTGTSNMNSNILIGYGVNAPDLGGSNQLNIGNLIYGASLGNSSTQSTGGVGIGVTDIGSRLDVSPTAAQIGLRVSGSSSTDMVRITQTGSGNALVVEDIGNPDSSPFVIDSSGNVGIGTTTPQAPLFTKGNFSLGTGGASPSYGAFNWIQSLNTFTFRNAIGDRGVQIGTNVTLSGGGGTVGGVISGVAGTGVGGLVLNGSTPSDLTSSKDLVITNAGNIGMGTVTPTSKLHVVGTSNLEGILFVGNTSSTGGISNARFNNSISGGATSTSVFHAPTVQTGVTTVYGIRSQSILAANAALSSYFHFSAAEGIWSAGSSISQNFGFVIGSDFNRGTTNVGFYGALTASSSNWNVYMPGTAANYLQGDLRIGSATDSGYKLDVAGTGRTSGLIVSNIVGVGTTTPNSKSILDLTSTSQGFLPPRMTNVQITGITSPPEGLTIYSTDAKTLVFYNGTSWQKVTTTTL